MYESISSDSRIRKIVCTKGGVQRTFALFWSERGRSNELVPVTRAMQEIVTTVFASAE